MVDYNRGSSMTDHPDTALHRVASEGKRIAPLVLVTCHLTATLVVSATSSALSASCLRVASIIAELAVPVASATSSTLWTTGLMVVHPPRPAQRAVTTTAPPSLPIAPPESYRNCRQHLEMHRGFLRTALTDLGAHPVTADPFRHFLAVGNKK